MTSYKRIGALKKGIEILAFLSQQEKAVSGQAVADALQMPYATSLCYLATLEDDGLVCLEGDTWRLGMGLAMYWSKYKRRLERQKYDIDKELEKLSF